MAAGAAAQLHDKPGSFSHSVCFCPFSDPCKEDETTVVMAVQVNESQTSLACKLKTCEQAIDVLPKDWNVESMLLVCNHDSENI